MKTVSQLGSGRMPVGTTAYMGRAEHLLQCRCDVQRGNTSLSPLWKHFLCFFKFLGSCYIDLAVDPSGEREMRKTGMTMGLVE